MSNFTKIRPVGAGVVPRGQTDMTKLTVALRNFANAPKCNQIHIIRGLSGKYPAILNMSRTGHVTLI